MSSFYFDNIGDGYVDSIYMKVSTDIEGDFADQLVDGIIYRAIPLPDYWKLKVNEAGMTTKD